MLRLAGEIGDSARLHPFHTRKYLLKHVAPEIETGLERTNRDRSELEVVADTLIATGPDEEAAMRARAWARFRIAFYSSTPAYWPVLAAHGLEDLGHKPIEYPRAGRRSAMAEQVPEELIDLFAVSGTGDAIHTGIAERFTGYRDAVSWPKPKVAALAAPAKQEEASTGAARQQEPIA